MTGLFGDPLFWLAVAVVGGLAFVGSVFGNLWDAAERRDARRRNGR